MHDVEGRCPSALQYEVRHRISYEARLRESDVGSLEVVAFDESPRRTRGFARSQDIERRDPNQGARQRSEREREEAEVDLSCSRRDAAATAQHRDARSWDRSQELGPGRVADDLLDAREHALD